MTTAIITRCRICNRTVTSELSIKRQAGAKCYRLWKHGYRGIQVKQYENVQDIEKKLVKGTVNSSK